MKDRLPSRPLRKRRIQEWLGVFAGRFVLIVINVLALGIFCGLLWKAGPILQATPLGDLLFSSDWHPLKNSFGLFPFIAGTLAVTGLAMLMAIPVCLLASVYLAEYAGQRFREVARLVIDILAGIPSVIYGLCGILVIVPFVAWLGDLAGASTTGYSLLAGGIVLAIMVFPLMVAVTDEVLRNIPQQMRESTLALGATRWETTWVVVRHACLPGILAAVVLAFSRAFGETLAIVMVIGNRVQIPRSLFDAAYPLPALIANAYSEMMSIPLYQSALMLASLVLMVIVLIFNIAARLTIVRLSNKG